MSLPVPMGSQTPASMNPALNGPPGWRPAGPEPVFGQGISAEQKLELLEYWRSITKRKWAILGLGLVVAVVAAVLSLAMAPVYQASTTVLIEAGKGKIVSIEEVYSVSQQRENYQTQIEILKSREVAERSVRALKLWEQPAFDPRKAKPNWRQRLMAAAGIAKTEVKSDWTEQELVDATIGRVAAGLTVTPVRGSQLVRVQFESEDRDFAARMANTFAQQYIESERDDRYKITQQVSQQLQERLTDLREKLTKSEKLLQAYRDQRGIVALGGSAQASAGQAIGNTLTQLSEARGRRAALEGEYQQARAAGADFSSIPSVARSPLVAEAQRLTSAAQAKLAELQQTLGPAHYKVQQAESEVAELRATLRRNQLAAVAVLNREYEAARATEQSLDVAYNSARGAVQSFNREEFELSVLDREYQSNRQLYEMFMSRAKETNLTGDIQPSLARVIDRAIPPSVPVKPNKRQIVLVSLLLALLLGALASVLLDRLDNTIKGMDDAEIRLKLPVLAALPIVAQGDRAKMVKMFLSDPHSHFAEGIRTARTGVMLSSLDVKNKILLITSTLPDEGKTTVSINLALAHAQTKRTLLIDCDMRRSQVSRSLGLSAGGKGLSNLVAGTASADDCITSIPGTSLHVLPVGELPPNPLDLLLSVRFKETLAELSAEYDMIVIDSPPVELVSEALVLAPMVTNTALVVKAMSTPAPLVRKSLMRLQRAGGNMLGVIVNRLDFSRAQRYYGEYGSSSYSYGSYGYAPVKADGKAASDVVNTRPAALLEPKAIGTRAVRDHRDAA